MSEQTENLGEDPTKDAFRRINSEDTWRSNGNGVARVSGDTASRRIEIAPECDRCNDSLWVLASGDGSGGNLVVVPCSCQATIDNARSQLRTYSQLGHLERMTFDALIPEGRSGRADEALFRAATETAKEFASEPSGWLVLEGSTGSGKTHLAAATVNAIIDRGSPAKYVSALDIPDLLRDERFEDDDAGGGTFISLLGAPILVIDDLGAQHATNWVDSKIDQLLTHRFNGRLPTIIVLAKPVSAMPERIALKLDDPSLSRECQLTSGSETNGPKRVNIPTTMLERMTFESFNPDGAQSAKPNERASLVIALTAARDFAKNPERWLYLHGPTGVGKTHLAVAIATVRAKKGDSITLWSVPDLLDNLRHTYSNPNESTFYALFDTVRNSELLILDDFGTQQMTDWALEKLYQLISHRHDRLLPTVITSQYILWEGADNSNLRQVRGKFQWESIRSRLNDSSVVTERLMAAPDYRNRGG